MLCDLKRNLDTVHPIISLVSVYVFLHVVLVIPTTPPNIVSPGLGEPNTSDKPNAGVITGVIITIIVIAVIVTVVLIALFIL